MQPLAGGSSQGILVSHRGTKVQQSVNSEAFWRQKAEDVAVDEVFFHKYFNQIGKGKDSAKKKEKKKGENEEDDGEDDEDEIWQALVESKPDIEGPESDDDDLDDFDMSEDDSEGGVDIERSDEEVDIEGEDEDEDMQDGEEDDGKGIFSEEDDDLKDSDDEAGSDMDALFEAELQRAKSPEAEEEKKETSRSKKRKLKNLPTFASAEDYAAMLDGDGDEDIGMGQ